MKIKPYKKEGKDSYSIGVFATLELLKYQKQHVTHILLHTKGEKNDGVQKIKELCTEQNIPFSYDDRTIESLSRNENTYAIGVFQKYASRIVSQENHLVLVNPSDTGNVGTIIRTACGFEIRNLVLVKPAIDIFDPKVIRASQGAVFQMNFLYVDSFEAYVKVDSGQARMTRNYYSFMLDGKVSLEDVRFETPYALLFGNEGAGLDLSYEDVGTSIKIPQSDAIDSLNLAISAGIGLYKAYTTTRHSGE